LPERAQCLPNANLFASQCRDITIQQYTTIPENLTGKQCTIALCLGIALYGQAIPNAPRTKGHKCHVRKARIRDSRRHRPAVQVQPTCSPTLSTKPTSRRVQNSKEFRKNQFHVAPKEVGDELGTCQTQGVEINKQESVTKLSTPPIATDGHAGCRMPFYLELAQTAKLQSAKNLSVPHGQTNFSNDASPKNTTCPKSNHGNSAAQIHAGFPAPN
jgi:hypothetical protein